ncbi:MAG: peptidylprolyl isomerase [Oscillospiraceae bacterium]|nr:peptidylprolyl isomerase [Oscillospiraceae bacterium]
MSASSKKKLRNELNAAAMTEKQLQEQKEAKKLRLYTGLFAAAIVVMILVVIVSRVFSSGIIPRSTTALTVGGTKVSAAELNHYYVDSVNNFLSEYGSYAAMFGLDTSKPLDEQFYNEAENQTWADYFIDNATTSAQNMYAVYNAAMAEGFTMSEEGKVSVDNAVANYGMYAGLYGFGSADAYIAAMYGEGCNEDTFRHYAEVQTLASEFAAAKNESLTYDDAAIRAEDDANPDEYSSFTYNYYYLANSKFYEGGTYDEETKTTTYSDEEKEAGRAAAEAAANSLLTATTTEELDAAIAALEINAEAETAPKSTLSTDTAYNSVLSVLRDWIAADERKAGDIAVIPNETTTHNHAEGEECTGDDGETVVNGYYVVRFENMNENLTNLVNVRHVLVSFEGGTTDSNGTVTYSDEEKAKAKTAAEEILAAFEAGEKTEESFAALATEKSTDTGSKANGGLYEDVYPGQMVKNFNDWCFDSARKTGDTGIVETEYGYHVMYFVSTDETTYRDLMIETTLRSEAMTEWETGLIESNELVVKNTNYVRKDLTLGSAT